MTQAISYCWPPSGLHYPRSGRERTNEVRHEEPATAKASNWDSGDSGHKVETLLYAPRSRLEVIRSIRGKYANVPGSSDEFMREKHREAESER